MFSLPQFAMKTVPAFLKQSGRVLNSGQARTLLLTGNINDLFGPAGPEQNYVPLLPLLTAEWDLPNYLLIVYELNGPIRFARETDADKVRDAWLKWRSGYDSNELAIKRLLDTYDDSLRKTVQMPTLALELLRQMCLCARTQMEGKRLLEQNLLILIEGADMLLPDAPIQSLSDMDRQR